jgi:hypothetical protein
MTPKIKLVANANKTMTKDPVKWYFNRLFVAEACRSL